MAIGLILLVAFSGCSSLYAFHSFLWPGDQCHACSWEDQKAAAGASGGAALAGIAVAAVTCAFRSPWWIVGMVAGFLIALAGSAFGWSIANAGWSARFSR